MTEARRKKRPAPSVPVPMKRELQAVSLKAIQAEMRTIEKRQVELETLGKNIELSLRQLPPPGENGTDLKTPEKPPNLTEKDCSKSKQSEPTSREELAEVKTMNQKSPPNITTDQETSRKITLNQERSRKG